MAFSRTATIGSIGLCQMTHAARQFARTDSVSATDALDDVPPERWPDLRLARRQFAEVTLPFDCRCLLQFCNDADAMFAELGFATPEAMIREGLGLDEAGLRLIVEWLDLNPQDEAVPLETARAAALRAHGGDRRSAEFQIRDTKLKQGRDNRDYILARLERDFQHELAAKVRAGQMSANAAAIEAGYRKQLSPFEIACRQIPKLSREERRQLAEALSDDAWN
jgi:hypothetical protein